MKILLIGPPLVGKGTQGQLISENLGLPRLSVGALIRRLYNKNLPEGIEASKYMFKGEAIPGNLLIKILKPWFNKHKKGFIVDNLIRTEDQLSYFKKFCSQTDFKIDKVIHLVLNSDEIYKRFKVRVEEHKKSNRLRPDETSKALENRINVYKQSIAKITEYFKNQGILTEISGNQSVKKVFEDIMDSLQVNRVDYD